MEPTLIEKLFSGLGEYGPLVFGVIGFFAALATFVKNKSDNRIVQLICDLVNFLALNIGKSKNDPSVD